MPAKDNATPSIVTQLREDLKEQPEYCLRPHQRMEYEEEASRLKTVVDAPDWQAGSAKVMARERYKKVLQTLMAQAPRAIDEPIRRDRVARLAQDVLDTVIKPAMLTRTEMRRNPAGAVGEFMRRENSPEVQTAIRTWQRAKFALEPDTTFDDHALIERHRPEGLPWNGAASFMADAQIPGQFAMTPQAKANWPLPAPENTAVEQVKQREKRVQTPAQRAATLANLAAGRAKRAAQQADAVPPAAPEGA